MTTTITRYALTLLLGAGVFLTGCGGGGGGGTPAVNLSGTAAAGAAIIGQVTVKGSGGKTVTAQIEANGNYSVNVSSLTAPYALRAIGTVGGRTVELHSYADAADVGGTVNITPFTDLIIANAAAQLASTYFDNFATTNTITTAALEEQETALQAKLQSVLTALGVDAAVDLLHTAFSADHTQMDAALDIVLVEVDASTNVATITNLIDSTRIKDSVIDSTDNSPTLSVISDLSAVQVEFNAINSLFTNFSALFATGLPSAAQLAPFLSDDFLFNDRSKAVMTTLLSTNSYFTGVAFTNTTIDNLDLSTNTATVSFHFTFNGEPDLTLATWELAKSSTSGLWELRGDRRIVHEYVNFLCDYGNFTDGTTNITCGMTIGVEDADATNNPGGVLVDSAKLTLLRNGSPVPGVVVYLGVPTNGGFAGELKVYDENYDNDFISFGSGARQIDGSLIQDGDVAQVELYTAALNLADVNNPAVTGAPIATYNTPIIKAPFLNATADQFAIVSQSTLNALVAYRSGNLAVSWTTPTGATITEISIEICDATTCLDSGNSSSVRGRTSTTLTTDTSSLNFTSGYSIRLSIYADNGFDQELLTTIYADATGVGDNGTPGGTVVDQSIVGAWDFNDGTEYGMLVFYPNGYYIHWQDGSIDPNCGMPVGAEYGTYTFDGTTLTTSQIVDANSCGLTGFISGTIAVTATTLSFDGTSFLTRIEGGAGSIVGAWGDFFQPGSNGGALNAGGFVYNNNGRYIHWQDGSDPTCAQSGVEYGTYALSGTDLMITTLVDENGDCGGLSSVTGSSTATNVSVSGDILNYDTYPVPRVTGAMAN